MIKAVRLSSAELHIYKNSIIKILKTSMCVYVCVCVCDLHLN